MKPLSEHALAELRNIAKSPEPSCNVNPGVVRKLLMEGLAEVVQLPSPFKTHKGGMTEHLRATAAGLDRALALD